MAATVSRFTYHCSRAPTRPPALPSSPREDERPDVRPRMSFRWQGLMNSNSSNPLQDSTNQAGKQRAPNKEEQDVKAQHDESYMPVDEPNRGAQPAPRMRPRSPQHSRSSH